MISWVRDKLHKLVEAIANAVSAHSYSRATFPIGEDLVKGLEVGLEKELATFRTKYAPMLRNAVTIQATPVWARGGQVTNVTNYNTYQGASIAVNASYAQAQSPSSIRQDLRTVAALL